MKRNSDLRISSKKNAPDINVGGKQRYDEKYFIYERVNDEEGVIKDFVRV